MRFWKRFDARRMIIRHFSNIWIFPSFHDCRFLPSHILEFYFLFIVSHWKLYESLYEPFRQWLGWQLTGGSRSITWRRKIWILQIVLLFVSSWKASRCSTAPWGILESVHWCQFKLRWNRNGGAFDFLKILFFEIFGTFSKFQKSFLIIL